MLNRRQAIKEILFHGKPASQSATFDTHWIFCLLEFISLPTFDISLSLVVYLFKEKEKLAVKNKNKNTLSSHV